MNKNKLRTASLILLAGLIPFMFSACGAFEKIFPPKPIRSELIPVSMPAEDQGLVSFAVGSVERHSGDDWRPAAVGDRIGNEESLRTGSVSFAEVQFGSIALMRLLENSEVRIDLASHGVVSPHVRITVVTGSIIMDVDKLLDDTIFRVGTELALVDVRGTQFMVSSGLNTVVAVKEGNVRISPAYLDVEKLQQRYSGKNAEFSNSVLPLAETYVNVGAEQEITIKRADSLAAEASYRALDRALDGVLSQPTASAEELARLQTAASSTAGSILASLGSPTGISDVNESKLDSTEKMRWMQWPGVDQESQTGLVKIAVLTEPESSRVSLNGVPLGRGGSSILALEGEALSFGFQQTGYRDQTLDITVKRGEDLQYGVKLVPEIDPDILQRLRADLTEEIRKELRDEILSGMREEIEVEVRTDMETRIRSELRDEVREELETAKPQTISERIVGMWETLLEGSLVYMEFNPDGSFRTLDSSEEVVTEGTYDIANQRLIMAAPDGSGSEEARIEFPTDWKIVVTALGQSPVPMYRSY